MKTDTDKYAALTNEEFMQRVHDLAHEKGTDWLLSLGDVYAIVAEELNNEVLEKWEEEHRED
jgi:hypothetical protein